MTYKDGTKMQILAPIKMTSDETFETTLERLSQKGFLRIRLNDKYYEVDEDIPYQKGKKNALFLVIDRLVIKKGMESRLLEAIEQAGAFTKEPFVVALGEEDLLFNLAFAVKKTGKSYPPITPHTFSFNSEEGMCLDCHGLGFELGANLTQHEPVMKLSAKKLLQKLWKEESTKESEALFIDFLKNESIDPNCHLYKLPPKHLNILLNGSEKSFTQDGMKLKWRGLNELFALTVKCAHGNIRETIKPLLKETICHGCAGKRLNPLARNVLLNGISLPDLTAFPTSKVLDFFQKLPLSKEKKHLFEELLEQLTSKLKFLNDIGLDYLSIDRSAPTLSGGETQRIHLAKQLGSGLTGCLYILDEPTIGLHPHNNQRLNKALIELRDKGNTLILVEHDPETMKIADHIIDFGKGAGVDGGEITASGTLKEIMQNENSLTGAYLSGRKKIPINPNPRTGKEPIKITHAKAHNLKDLTLSIPTDVITCITGVSGSGKSTLMHQIIKPAAKIALNIKKAPIDSVIIDETEISGLKKFTKLISLDQNPIGHTSRSDVSTYSDLLTPLRSFYSSLPEAKIKGLQPRHFSYHHKKGMCKTCFGLGFKKIYLQFLPPVEVKCDACHGNRLNPLSLKVTYKEKNFGELLQLTVIEAQKWLPLVPKIHKILETLLSVGLGYLTLGLPISTLSGGEAGRLRLTKELAKRQNGKTLYLFDEPSIGLHSSDIEKLVSIF
ncbi:MAG: ATP-binding cassette domain-containing protein, partial [Simkaniaceae bacterium]|nr:ATP-binding cassette domain-containing protein [Simkaniaceae bacterium]